MNEQHLILLYPFPHLITEEVHFRSSNFEKLMLCPLDVFEEETFGFASIKMCGSFCRFNQFLSGDSF